MLEALMTIVICCIYYDANNGKSIKTQINHDYTVYCWARLFKSKRITKVYKRYKTKVYRTPTKTFDKY